jgi:hypothetical protein
VRSKLGKAVRKRFRQQLCQRFPGLKEIRGAEVPPGWLVFGVEVAPDLTFYVVLVPYRQQDRFTLEGAWTRNCRFPISVGLLEPKDSLVPCLYRDEPRNGDFRFRVARLWQGQEFEWDLAPQPSLADELLKFGRLPEQPPIEEALSRVDATVYDALERIDQYLVPYFDQVAAGFSHDNGFSKSARAE